MKKHSDLQITIKQKGFILPYAIFITSIVLIAVTSIVSIYSHHHEMTGYLEEQIKIDTLLQMGQQQFKEEWLQKKYEGSTSGETKYNYPYGYVTIRYQVLDEASISLQQYISTSNGAIYGQINTMRLETGEDTNIEAY